MKKVIKKSVSPQPVTLYMLQSDLRSVEAKLNEKIDAVKVELNDKIEVTEKILREEIRLTAGETVEKVDEKSRLYRDQILTKFDQFLGEIVTARDERVLVSHKLNNHEERLTELESQTGIPAI